MLPPPGGQVDNTLETADTGILVDGEPLHSDPAHSHRAQEGGRGEGDERTSARPSHTRGTISARCPCGVVLECESAAPVMPATKKPALQKACARFMDSRPLR